MSNPFEDLPLEDLQQVTQGKCERCEMDAMIYPDLGICRVCYTELEEVS